MLCLIPFTANAQSDYDAEINRILAKIEPGMTNLDKLIAVYQHFTMNYKYDLSGRNVTAYSLFTNGSSTCEGFSEGLKLILDRLGFENDYAYSPNHRWNMIKLDGEWYHVDITWDNPTSTVEDFPYTHFAFFLVNDKQLKDPNYYMSYGFNDIKGHDLITASHKSTSTKYENAIWQKRGNIFPINYVDGYWYFNNSVLGIQKYDPKANTAKTIYSASQYESEFDAQEYGFLGPGLFKHGHCLYTYTSRALCRYDINSGKFTQLKKYNETGYYLNGLNIIDDTIHLYMQKGGISAPIVVETFLLDKVSKTVDVTIKISPADCQVKFDGNMVKPKNGVVTIKDVPLGTYSYSIWRSGYKSSIKTVTVSHTNFNFKETLTKTHPLTFNCNVEGAKVSIDTYSGKISGGTLDFTAIPEGTHKYTVTADGRITYTGTVNVTSNTGPLNITLYKETFLTEISGLRAMKTSFDEKNRIIDVVAEDNNSTAGFAVIGDVISNSSYTCESSKNITRAEKDGKVYFIANQKYGKAQSFKIHIISTENITYTYTVNIKFIDESELIKDIVTLRTDVMSVNYQYKKITITCDRFNILSKSGTAAIALIPIDGANVSYEFDANASNSLNTDFAGKYKTDKYTSYKTGTNYESSGGGNHGDVTLYYVERSAVSSVVKATVTFGDYSAVYTINIQCRDISKESNSVNIAEIIPLRANPDSFILDNKAKTIYFESAKGAVTAGFTVSTNDGLTIETRPRKVVTAVSGYDLVHGNINATNEPELANKCNRYVIAKKAIGETQVYKIKVVGGSDGLSYCHYTVTVKFV